MTTKTTTTPPRNQGAFLGATTARISFDNHQLQGVVFLWERAIEVRSPQTRHVFPRANVRNVQPIGRGNTKGLTLNTNTGPLVIRGAHLAHWGHRVDSWMNRKIPYGRTESTWGGGRVTRSTPSGSTVGTLSATAERVWFFPSANGAQPTAIEWSELTVTATVAYTENTRLTGDGIDSIYALMLAGKVDSSPASTQTVLTSKVDVGWSRTPHMLAIRPEGLALVPTSRWGRWWNHPVTFSWHDIIAINAAGPQAIRIELSDRHIRLESAEVHALLAELRRVRHAAARVNDRAAAVQGRTKAGWVIQVRAPESDSWRWAHMRREGGDIVVDSADRAPIRQPIGTASWWPTSDRPLTLAMATPRQVIHVRPVSGHRLLPIWSRWLGPPVHADVEPLPRLPRTESTESRRDVRIPLAVHSWLDPNGAIPDTAFHRAESTVEVSMSSVVLRWPGALCVSQEVGLALALGGPPSPAEGPRPPASIAEP